jgi:hypothetical protein
MKIGVTGHQQLDNPSRWSWVVEEINRILNRYAVPVIGVTSLAPGADQLFAKLVLKHSGSLMAIIPFDTYELEFTEANDLSEYKALLAQASTVEVLEKGGSNEEAFLFAGQRVVELSDIIVAVWDGKPAAGLGGTGDAVDFAKKMKKKIIHINPDTYRVFVLN